MIRARFAAVIAVGLGVGAAGAALAFAGGNAARHGLPARSSQVAAGTSGPGYYSYYGSMMDHLRGGSTTGGSSYGWLMGGTGYSWMMGGTAVPGWMGSGASPAYMMGTNGDAGKIMGTALANAPGARVSKARAVQLGDQIPVGATVDRARNHITFSGTSIRLAAVASAPGGRDETFRIAGLTDPAITVRAGAEVTIEMINADPDTAHGLAITAASAASQWMPMMSPASAFTGSAVWILGNPTSAGLHAATLTFTATTAGRYEYLCPVPGHARQGMAGALTVTGTS